MGMFSWLGQGKKNKGVSNALQPTNVSIGDFGSITGDRNNMKLNPNDSFMTKQNRETSDNKMGSLLSGFNTDFSPESTFNNPMYQALSSYGSKRLGQDYAQDKTNMNNDLNATGQLGSSYDALMRKNMDYNYGKRQDDVNAQAQQMGFDFNTSNQQNQMVMMQALQGWKGSSINQSLAPLQFGLQASQIGSGIASQQANYLSGLNTWGQNIDAGRQDGAQMLGAVLKGMGGGA
jgi:hypothetical protein